MKIKLFTAKKILLLLFVFLIIFIVFPVVKVSASLEVQYPKLANGDTLTDQSTLVQYLKYIFDVGVFIGFCAVFASLIWAGVIYLMSGAKPEMVAEAKDRVAGAISGLLILTTLVLILITINPQLRTLTLTPLPATPTNPPPPPQPGVNFYKSADCSGDTTTNTSSVADFGTALTNKINSAKIIADQNTAYISILYDTKNLWGKCQYINPNTGCQQTQSFNASASIYQFDFSPSGDGVYIYRNSYFNDKGGYLKISNSDIENSGSSKLYVGNLTKLKFTGESSAYDNLNDCTVPKGEQNCLNYNKKGECTQKVCPTLAGENISSIKIKGNYLVLLVYFSPTDDSNGPWTSCQAYPTLDDVNKTGPNQIKWDGIRNLGANPNYIVIIPVTQK